MGETMNLRNEIAAALMLLLPAAASAQAPPGLGSEEFGMTQRQLVQAVEQVEQLMQNCMRDQGFQYVAVDYETIKAGMRADKRLPGLSEEEFIQKHGFGLATLYTGQPPQLATGYSPAKTGLGDRNVEIFKSLPGKPREQVVRECTPINYSPHTQQQRPELIESLIPLFVDNRQRAQGYAGQLKAIWEFNAFDRLPQLAVPTLVMTRTDDVLVVPGNSKIIAERIPNARLIEFPEAGHLFFIEKAEEVNRDLIEFFQ